MASILSSNLLHCFRDHKGLERRRALSRLESQLWQFCLLPTSIFVRKEGLRLKLEWREYVGGMDGLMKVFVDNEEEIALPIRFGDGGWSDSEFPPVENLFLGN